MFPSWYAEAERLYVEEKLSYIKIGEKLGVGRKTVSHYLRLGGHESNLKFRANNAPDKKYRRYQLDEDVFDRIDTEEKAYWLGMFYADASISGRNNDIELGLKEEDYNHLIKLQSFFKTDKPIYSKEKRENGKVYKGFRLIINSAKIKESLMKLGCYPKKSHILKFPTSDQVPDYLLHHFIRGYFDGDGCITRANGGKSLAIELIGTQEFLEGYQRWANASHQKIHDFNHSTVKRAQHFGKDAENILINLYKDATVYLDRKYSLYKKYVLPS